MICMDQAVNVTGFQNSPEEKIEVAGDTDEKLAGTVLCTLFGDTWDIGLI